MQEDATNINAEGKRRRTGEPQRDKGDKSSRMNKKSIRLIACLRCRGQKLKCQFSNPQATVCDRCRSQKKECTFEKKFDESLWRKQTDGKIERLESSINSLIALLQDKNMANSPADKDENLGKPEPSGSNEFTSVIHNILSDVEIDLSLDFFYNTLSKYLPIFIFDYIPKVTREMEKTSEVLLTAILSVTSLYMPEFRHSHQVLLSQFKELAGNLSPGQIFDKDGRPYNLKQTLYDMLGCIIAATWVSDDVGVRCCLIAGDLAGRMNPQILDEMNITDGEKRAVFAFSLTSYIIERRLQISYTKSDIINMKNDMSANRDFFLPLYLSKMFHQKDNSEPVSTEYKVNANVELCTLTMAFQNDLAKSNDNLTSEFILNWSSKLNMWLADWIGRLTTHLDQSSIKPTLLMFHFSKLFLYIQAINNIKSHKDILSNLFNRAETAALDMIEMLLLDLDIRRLIKLGPAFYATIFVTATALLLKIVTVGPKLNYKFNDKHLIMTSERAYTVLSECITDYQFPCYPSVLALGRGITKVKERIAQKVNIEIQFDGVNQINSKNTPFSSSMDNNDEPINQNANIEMPDQNLFDLRFDSAPLISTDTTVLNQNPIVNPVTDYKEVWESNIFDTEDFLWNGFNAALMKSLYESPTDETI